MAMMQGDQVAARGIQMMDEGAGQASRIRSLANRYGIATATEQGVPLDRRVVDTINKFLRGEYDEGAIKFSDLTREFRSKVDEFVSTPRGEMIP